MIKHLCRYVKATYYKCRFKNLFFESVKSSKVKKLVESVKSSKIIGQNAYFKQFQAIKLQSQPWEIFHLQNAMPH